MSKASAQKVALATTDPFDPLGSEERLLAAFELAANAFDAKHTKSRAAARKQLVKSGIITKTGKLTRRYRAS